MKTKHITPAILLVVATLEFISCITPRRGPQKALNNAVAVKPFDVIVVPGIPFRNDAWDSVMKARVLWSWILYKNGFTKNVIYSGAAVYSPYKEALIMGLYGQQLGIPAEHIFYDTLAKHSTENMFYSYLLAKQLGFKSIALATDPFQSFLLRGFTRRRFETPVYMLPFITDSLAVYNYLNPRIDPASARVDSFTSITDQKSFYKRFRGTIGRDIDWTPYPDNRLGPL